MKLSEMKGANQDNFSSTNFQKQQDEAESLKGKPHDELLQRLFDEVKSQKERGVFDYDSLFESVKSLRSMVGEETYQNLLSLVERLK